MVNLSIPLQEVEKLREKLQELRTPPASEEAAQPDAAAAAELAEGEEGDVEAAAAEPEQEGEGEEEEGGEEGAPPDPVKQIAKLTKKVRTLSLSTGWAWNGLGTDSEPSLVTW